VDMGTQTPTEDEVGLMIKLSFEYVEPRFRFGLLTPELMTEIVDFRTDFHDSLPDDLKDGVELFDPEKYMTSGSLLDNMLFGRISQKYRDGAERIFATVAEMLRPLGLHETVLKVGLDFHVGAGGKRLTSAQRQKFSLVRALIRTSEYYLFNKPLSAIDARSQEQILDNVLAYLRRDGRNPGIVWVISQNRLCRVFDRIAVFDRGMLVEDGIYDDLVKKNGIFKEMLSA
jgi:putative ABC transport system ATP-binding protein